jgi:hypothetical protein
MEIINNFLIHRFYINPESDFQDLFATKSNEEEIRTLSPVQITDNMKEGMKTPCQEGDRIPPLSI